MTTKGKKPRRAVIYLRVSTLTQVETDYDPEGQSIPTQRDACLRKAEELDAEVAAEFVDPGKSGRNIDRPKFQEMMTYLRNNQQIDYVIVYNRARMHRDTFDSNMTTRELDNVNAFMVSVLDYTENTLEGRMMAKIIDNFNEYQSHAAGALVKNNMAAKARRGGTVSTAKLGYLNIREEFEGRTVRTVRIDPDRAPHIKSMFDLYATGAYSTAQLQQIFENAGLTTRPTKKFPKGKALSQNQIQNILADPYYTGEIHFKGEKYPGLHEPLISPDTFDHVQSVRKEKTWQGNRDRKWDHYLKGLPWCGRCSDRLLFMRARGRNDLLYFYFACNSRVSRTLKDRNKCSLPYIPEEVMERLVEQHWTQLDIHTEEANAIRQELDEALSCNDTIHKHLTTKLRRELSLLDNQENQIMELLGDPNWPTEKLTQKMTDIQAKRESVQASLDDSSQQASDYETSLDTINTLLEMLHQPHKLYMQLDEADRKTMNAACIDRLFIDAFDPDVPYISASTISSEIEPLLECIKSRRGTNTPKSREKSKIATNSSTEVKNHSLSGHVSSKTNMVGATGIEPVTTTL